MIKKFIPILAVVGSALLITGCSNNITMVKPTQTNSTTTSCLTKNKNNILKKQYFNKYNIQVDNPTTLELSENDYSKNNMNDDINDENLTIENQNELVENNETAENNTEIELENNEYDKDSPLYELSKDFEEKCDDFCELKEKINDAILQTEDLITKINNNELELTREQRLYLNEQTLQLKNLGKRLSFAATELSFNLSDLKQVLDENNSDIDQLSLKYLIVLDNLVNSNEMLQSGLMSLNLMNNMINNPYGRITYKYQKNNEEPIIKDYYINENNDLVENTNTEDSENVSESETSDKKFKSNIDSYYSNTPKNIDTFFNTALFNNELMYGNGGYGFNPYMNQYAMYENRNVNQNLPNAQNNTNINRNSLDEDGEKVGNKERKIKKNIDTYRDENTPSLKTRISNFKEKISNTLNNINPKENLKNPVYRY